MTFLGSQQVDNIPCTDCSNMVVELVDLWRRCDEGRPFNEAVELTQTLSDYEVK